MTTLAEIVLWGSALALVHTYIFYPMLMRWLAAGRVANEQLFDRNDPDLPHVSVIMSVFNEEKVIRQKLESLARLDYPPEKLRVFVGSDCSDDATNQICREFPISNFQFQNFPIRRGKPSVVNDLVKLAFTERPPTARHILLLTDASVMLQPDTLFHLVKHFRNPKIGAVDAHMVATGLRREGISRSEDRYIGGETRLKNHESRAWGLMIGPFGGCYALRSDLFEPLPPHHLVDDFWLVFRALERGFAAINDLDAVCHEGATHRVGDEFRRKKRIAAGSFQNLSAFRRWVLPPATRLGFAFFSHKVLRWFGGFFIAFGLLACGFLAFGNQFYRLLFCLGTAALVAVPLLDWVFTRLKINVLPVRNLAYFLVMNAALVAGFFKFTGGIRSGTWQRTARE